MSEISEIQREVRLDTRKLLMKYLIFGEGTVRRDANQDLAWLPANLFRTVSGLQHASGTSRNVAANGKARRDGLPDAVRSMAYKIPCIALRGQNYTIRRNNLPYRCRRW